MGGGGVPKGGQEAGGLLQRGEEVKHLKFKIGVANEENQRRDWMSSSADRHLGGLCEWGLPKGGMFFWMRAKGVKNTWDLIMNRYVKGDKK